MDGPVEVDLDEAPDDAAPPGPRPRRRRRVLLTGLGAVVVAAVVAGALVSRAVDDGGPPPPGPGATAEELYPVLAEPQAPGTAYPGAQLASSLGVASGSARQVGTTATATFWLALTGSGRVCLLSRDDADTDGLGGTCSTTAEAAAAGLRLTAGEGVGAVAVPRGADPSEVAGPEHRRVADLLWVDADSADRAVEAVVDDAVDVAVVVPSRAATGADRLPVFLTTRDAPYAIVLVCLGAPGGSVEVGVGVDGRVPEPVGCSRDAAYVRFDGDGRPVRVEVDAPASQLWAAAVVACRGSLLGPVC